MTKRSGVFCYDFSDHSSNKEQPNIFPVLRERYIYIYLDSNNIHIRRKTMLECMFRIESSTIAHCASELPLIHPFDFNMFPGKT